MSITDRLASIRLNFRGPDLERMANSGPYDVDHGSGIQSERGQNGDVPNERRLVRADSVKPVANFPNHVCVESNGQLYFGRPQERTVTKNGEDVSVCVVDVTIRSGDGTESLRFVYPPSIQDSNSNGNANGNGHGPNGSV